VNGAIAWFARNHVAANLLLGVIVLGGLASLPSMPQKAFPDVDIPVITVLVPYLGAAPEEVEEGVCIRVEEELDGVDGIERVISTSSEGMCSVRVELFEDADESRALDDVKNRIDAIDTFPEETEKPIISALTVQRSVMDIAVTGPEDERTLKQIGQRVRDEIAALPEVTQVALANTRPYEISIEVSEASLRRHALSFEQVAGAVRAASLDLPGGSIKTDAGEIVLRTKGQAYRGVEFEELVVITNPDGSRVHLREVAQVVDGFEDTDQLLRFDGKPAAIVRVSRVGEQDIIEITTALKAYLANAAVYLPEGVELTIWSDGSRQLRDRLDTLLHSARQGFLMILLLLALFLRPGLAFWVVLGVPVSILGGLLLIGLLGGSIDSISLFGFIVVLGILVDDAIVIGESVHTRQQRSGGLLDSAIAGTQEVSVPVIFGVLTTVAAFVPFLFGPGTMGQIQLVIAGVVMCCLLVSLVESQLVLPAHLGHQNADTPAGEVALILVPLIGILLFSVAWDLRSYIGLAIGAVTLLYAAHKAGFYDPIAAALVEAQVRFAAALEEFIEGPYRRLVGFALEWRYASAALALAIFISAIGVFASGRLPFSFFPPLEADRVSAKLTMPLGTAARVTEEAVLHLESTARALAEQLAAESGGEGPVLHLLAAVGGHPVTSASNGPPGGEIDRSGGGHLGEVTMQLTPSETRDLETRDVANRWRAATGSIPDAIELTYATSLFSAGEAINIQLEGDDLNELRAIAAKLRVKLSEYPGVIDISDSFRSGKTELKLDILPSGEVLGLKLGDLAKQVRQAFYGEEIQRIQRGRDDVRVMVRYTEKERRSLGALDDMRIRTPDGSEVPFATVAEARLGRGFSSIRRADRRRVVNVTADVDRTQITSNEVMADLRRGAMAEIMRDHPRVSYGLEGAQRQQSESAAGLLPLYAIALFVIYSLLAIPLRSYSQPFIIMSVIPFALVGAIYGHWLMTVLGFVNGLAMMSVFGFLAASGVVVNSSLVLVHYINGRRAEGVPLRQAASDASVARFRPIVLTSLTTFVGLAPLMLNRSVQAQFLVPMAISLAFGVLMSTIVTLLVVPSGYLILEDLRARSQRPAPALEPLAH
jgi:multidrug efflux pump subunit AcrB